MGMVRTSSVFFVAIALVGLLNTSTWAGSISYTSGVNTLDNGGATSFVYVSNAGTVLNITANTSTNFNDTTAGSLYINGGATTNILSGGNATSADVGHSDTGNTLNIYTGGSVTNAKVEHNSVVNLLGGSAGTLSTDSRSYGSGIINLYSGSVTGSINGYQNSTVNWYGGTASTLYATGKGTYNVYGTGLTFADTGTDTTISTKTYDLYSLAGTLQNGDALSANFYWDQSSPNVTVNLLAPTPEPASAALLLMGLGGLLMLPGRRRAVKGS